MKGSFVIEHYDAAGNKKSHYYGENALRADIFNGVLYQQFENTANYSPSLLNTPFVNHGGASGVIRIKHGRSFYNVPFKSGAVVNQFTSYISMKFRLFDAKDYNTGLDRLRSIFNIALFTADCPIGPTILTSGESLNAVIKPSISRTISTPLQEDVVTSNIGGSAFVYSKEGQQLVDFYTAVKNFRYGETGTKLEAEMRKLYGIPYNRNEHRIFIANEDLKSVSTALKSHKLNPGDSHYRFDYKVTISETFKNTLTTTLPITKMSLLYGHALFTAFKRTAPEITAEEAINSVDIAGYETLVATLANYNAMLSPGEELRVNYTITFELTYPVEGTQFTFTTPDELVKVGKSSQTYTGKVYFIREHFGEEEEPDEINYVDKDLLINGTPHSSYQYRYPVYYNNKAFPSKFYNLDVSALELHDFKITKLVPTFNQTNNNRDNLFYRHESDDRLFRLNRANIPSTKLWGTHENDKHAGYEHAKVTLTGPFAPFYLVNSMNYADPNQKTWYNWLIVLDKPFDYSPVNVTATLNLPGPSFLFDQRKPNSLKEFEEETITLMKAKY